MICDFECTKCGKVEEHYFPSLKHATEFLCLCDCGNESGMRRLAFGRTYISVGEISGYEKRNKDYMTTGKRFDQAMNAWF